MLFLLYIFEHLKRFRHFSFDYTTAKNLREDWRSYDNDCLIDVVGECIAYRLRSA